MTRKKGADSLTEKDAAEIVRRRRSYTSMTNNAQGRLMEDMIIGACQDYERKGIARIIKVPEPFRVIKNTERSRAIATVRFTGKAEPDFIGCIRGGRMIAFECKYTRTERMRQNAVTAAQGDALTSYGRLGAGAYVCCGIGSGLELQYFMIPWQLWERMHLIYGRRYLTSKDIQQYRVKTDLVIHFLDGIIRFSAGAESSQTLPGAGGKRNENL